MVSPTSDPHDLTVLQHVHARRSAVVVHVEDQPARGSARGRQPDHRPAPSTAAQQPTQEAHVPAPRDRDASVRPSVVAPAAQRFHESASVLVEQDAGQTHPAVAAAAGDPYDLAVREDIDP